MIDWAYYQKTWRTCCGYQGYHRGQILFSRLLARGWMSQSHFQLMLLATFFGTLCIFTPNYRNQSVNLYLVLLASFHKLLDVQLSRVIRVNLCEHLVWTKTFSCLNDDDDGNHNDNNLGGGGGGDLFWKCLLFHRDLPWAWLPQRPAYYTQTARRARKLKLKKVIQK